MSYGIHAYPAWFDTLKATDLRHLAPSQLEGVVEQYAGMLDTSCWCAMRMDWFDAVDEALKAAGSTVSLLNDVFNREAAITTALDLRWTTPSGVFFVGCAFRHEIDGLLVGLDVALSGAEAESVAEVRRWLREAKRLDAGLVTFYQ